MGDRCFGVSVFLLDMVLLLDDVSLPLLTSNVKGRFLNFLSSRSECDDFHVRLEEKVIYYRQKHLYILYMEHQAGTGHSNAAERVFGKTVSSGVFALQPRAITVS